MTKPLIQTTGRRKEAVARVRLRPGTGVIKVNGRTFEQYFPILTHQVVAIEPLRLTQTADVYDVDATLDGGGVSGQAGALRLGIARALVSPRRRAAPARSRRPGCSRATPARRSGASTASRRPARRRSTRSAESLPTRRHDAAVRHRRSPRRRERELTPELVTALGRAAARVLGADRPFVVGRDTRRSGPMLEAALVAGLCAEGADVHARRRAPDARGRVPGAAVRRARRR